LLGEMPQTLRAILEHALSAQEDIVVVHDESLACPDVLIVGAGCADHREVTRALLQRWPRTRILLVMEAGRRSVLYELRPHRTEFGELSPQELVAAVRAAVRRPVFTVS
jgi:hypothetical protein